ncbi:MAG: tetratricopeptide repeat protein [Rhodothermus sp.]|nr:tetratricopeptide repeat protein [Rhodothermus sp.]
MLLITCLGACRDRQEPYPPLLPETQQLLIQAEQAFQQQQFVRAVQLADSATGLQPDHPDILFFKGRLYTHMRLLDTADSLYRQIARYVPDYTGVWHNLANNAARRGQFRKAIALFRKELALHPNALSWRGIGRAYMELGQPDSARIAYEMALRQDSTYAEAWLDLAKLYENEGRYDEALQAAHRAWELVPQSLAARYRLGNLLLRTGQPEQARSLLEAVVQEAPWHQAAHYSLGRALQQLGALEAARRLLERAEVLRALQAKVEQAELLVANTPRDPYAYATLGSLLRQLGQYQEALYAYQVAHFLEPDNLEFQNNIAVLYLLMGREDQAIGLLEAAVQRDTTFVDGWINLGILYARQGRREAARRAWQQALRLAPDRPEPRRYLSGLQ